MSLSFFFSLVFLQLIVKEHVNSLKIERNKLDTRFLGQTGKTHFNLID